MHNPLVFDTEAQRDLDSLGAEPLVGSGFETEQSDSEFASEEFVGEEQ